MSTLSSTATMNTCAFDSATVCWMSTFSAISVMRLSTLLGHRGKSLCLSLFSSPSNKTSVEESLLHVFSVSDFPRLALHSEKCLTALCSLTFVSTQGFKRATLLSIFWHSFIVLIFEVFLMLSFKITLCTCHSTHHFFPAKCTYGAVSSCSQTLLYNWAEKGCYICSPYHM